MLYTKINKRSDWLLGKLPKHHPSTSRYVSFWREMKKNAVEGIWREDKENLYRYMPGKLWFYVNFGTIVDEDEKTKSSKIIRPELRDLEWELAYLHLETRGFSGFRDDDEYNSHTALASYYSGSEVIERLPKECISLETNKPKKYINPRENIKKLHSKPLGPPLYGNLSRNSILLGSRGGGKSFWNAHVLLHEILFDGVKFYTDEVRLKPPKAETFIGSAMASKSGETCSKIIDALNQLAIDSDLGVWEHPGHDDFKPSPFYKTMTGSLSPNNKGKFKHDYEKTLPNGEKIRGLGTQSYVNHGIFTIENPQAAVGGRYSELLIEEVGLCENIIEVLQHCDGCLRRRTKFGSASLIGTSGNMEKIPGTQRIFTTPDDYDMVSYVNDWEDGGGRIGFFLPCYYTHAPSKDDNGNTVLEDALNHFNVIRAKKRKSRDPKVYEGEIINYPMYPSEMWIKPKGNLLPTAEIIEVLRRKEKNKEFELYTKGSLLFDSDIKCGVRFKPDTANVLSPITDYPMAADDSREGALVVYEFPIEIDSEVPSDAYFIGCDPVANENEEGASFCYIPVLKGTKHSSKIGYNQLVAEYFGRPSGGRRVVNELLEKLNMFYGSGSRRIFFENKVGNVKEYFEKRGKLWMLATQPKTVLTNKDGSATSSDLYGYPINTKEHKLELSSYTYDWLLSERGSNGDQVIRNLDLIPSRLLLKQMAAFNLDDNFDAVMGFFGCILGLEETTNQYKDKQDESKVKDALDFLNNNKNLFPKAQLLTKTITNKPYVFGKQLS